MKKKLLLSSVAALTLFAAYNTASAQDTYGVDSAAVENLLRAFDITAPTTVDEVVETTENFNKRQKAAEDVRKANDALTDAKETEVNAEAAFQKAQEDYFTASKNYKLAKDTSVAAASKKEALEKTKQSIEAEKKTAKDELDKKKEALGTKAEEGKPATKAYLDQETANKNLEKAKKDVKEVYRRKPVSTTNVEAYKKYEADKFAAEQAVKEAEKAKKEADEKVAKLEKEISKLEEASKKAEKEIKVLEEAIEALGKVAGNQGQDNGVVNGVALSKLSKLVQDKEADVNAKQAEYVNSSANRVNAQKAFDQAVEAAKAVYKELNVEFNLEDVLAVDTPTPDAVTKFGWNKNDKGEWTYVVDSKGTTAKGWVNDGGSWYYLNKEGVMQKWWVNVDGTWYFLNGSGVMETGWLQDNGTWYYLEESGAMKANQWFEVGGKWYHVNESGALSVNTTVNGYNVNENGEWV